MGGVTGIGQISGIRSLSICGNLLGKLMSTRKLSKQVSNDLAKAVDHKVVHSVREQLEFVGAT